jgi:predicted enzyme related to lactoylglutathione lyase
MCHHRTAVMTRFSRVELRTTDVPAARLFYRGLLAGDGADIVPLPAEAIARGARPHWLGHLGVADVEGMARAFVAEGATPLGPLRPTATGGAVAILRDPGGAVVALATPPSAPVRAHVVWHSLNSADLARATASYCALMGWQLTDAVDLGPLGRHHNFAWSSGGPNVGTMADIAGRPGVHPHWLFHFRVAALEPALATVCGGRPGARPGDVAGWYAHRCLRRPAGRRVRAAGRGAVRSRTRSSSSRPSSRSTAPWHGSRSNLALAGSGRPISQNRGML